MAEDLNGLPAGYQFRPEYEMMPREAAERLAGGGFVLVDVREAEEVRARAIEGAAHVPLGQLVELWDDLEVEGDEVFGVVCAHGVRSMRAVLFLHQMGLTGARSVAGGVACWPAE